MKKYLLLLTLSALLGSLQAQAVPSSGTVNNNLPAGVSEGTIGQVMRLGKYRDQFVIPISAGLYGLADEGTYFTAMTATPGTGYSLSGATQTAWVATTPTVFMKNGASAGGKKMFPDACRFSVTTVPTAAASVHVAVVLDKGARTTSAGTALTIANVNGTSAALASIASQITAGAITASAATTPTYLYRGTLKNAAPVLGDSYTVNFAAMDSTGSAGGALSAGPVVIDGGETLLVYLWFPSQTGAGSGEVQCSWWER